MAKKESSARRPFKILLSKAERAALDAKAADARLPLGTWMRVLALSDGAVYDAQAAVGSTQIERDRTALIDVICTGTVQKLEGGKEPRLSQAARRAVKALAKERCRALEGKAMRATRR